MQPLRSGCRLGHHSRLKPHVSEPPSHARQRACARNSVFVGRPDARRGAQVRMVEARPGIAFVEFENEAQAAVAMSGLQLFQITPTKAMRISYAKQ